MRILPLRTYDLPDVGDHLILFTGRVFSVRCWVRETMIQHLLE